MAVVDVRAPARRGAGARHLALVAVAVALLVVALRLGDSAAIPQVRTFLLVFSSLLIEAVPFILLGAVVSAAI